MDDNYSTDSDNSLNGDINENNYIEKKYENIIFNNVELYKFENHDEEVNLCNILKNNMRGIKTVYYIILCLQIYEIKFRNNCKCCETSEYKLFNRQFDNNDVFIPIDYKIIFTIRKFFNVINKLPCQCNFVETKKFFKNNFLNFKEFINIYLSTIPTLISYLNEKYKINTNVLIDFKLLPLNRCIHEDIRNNNNIEFCKNNVYSEIYDKIKIINYLVSNLNSVNVWIIENIKKAKKYYLKQSCEIFKEIIKDEKDILIKFKKMIVKQFSVINLNVNLFDEDNLICIILNGVKCELIMEQMFNNILKELEMDKKYNEYIFDLIKLCLEKNKYKLSINLCNNIKKENEYKKYDNFINNLIKQILELKELDNKQKIKFLKILQSKNINNLKLVDLINFDCADDLIDFFEINSLKITSNDYDDIICHCVKKNKINVIKYVLDNFKNYISNPYIHYFNNIYDDYENSKILKTISNYNYDINVKINISFNKIFFGGMYDFLYFCIINNYNNSACVLIENNINLMNNYETKTSLIKCIDMNNIFIFDLIIKKNPELLNVKYKEIMPLNYIFNVVECDYAKLLFVKKSFDVLNIDINYFDENNKNICFEILKIKNKKYKIVLFNLLKNVLNPKIVFNNIPLILTSFLLDEFEITNILFENIMNNNLIKFNQNETEDIYKYQLINEKINYIPIIINYINKNKNKSNIDYKYECIIINDALLLILYLFIFFRTNKKKNEKLKNVIDNENEYFLKPNNENNEYNENNENNECEKENEKYYVDLEDDDTYNIWNETCKFEPSTTEIDENTEIDEDDEILEKDIYFSNI